MKGIILIAAICCVGCSPIDRPKHLNGGYYEVVIDGCQYIGTDATSNVLVHKGNCKNHFNHGTTPVKK